MWLGSICIWIGFRTFALDGLCKGKGSAYQKLVAASVRSFYKRNDSPLFGDFGETYKRVEPHLSLAGAKENIKDKKRGTRRTFS